MMARPKAWRTRLAGALAVVLAIGASAPAFAVRPTVDRQIAVLQGLDKVTARVSRMQVEVGDSASFGTLDIVVRACRSTRPDEAPENGVFLEISDKPPGEPSHGVFSGWMFSSSPAVSALDHPVFDIWVLRCVDELLAEPENFGVAQQYRLPNDPPVPARPPAARRR